MNYLNGHFQEGQGYLGHSVEALAGLLHGKGLASGNNIILTGCDSSVYAASLAVELHKLGIDVTVTGAKGIAFDYKNGEGIVIEKMYDSKKIPHEVNELHNVKNKLVIAHKYEEIFINEITSTIFKDGELQKELVDFLVYFKVLGRSHIKYQKNTDLTDARIEELATAQKVFKEAIKNANGPDIEEWKLTPPTIDQLVAFSKNNERPAFSKPQLISFSKSLNNLIPQKIDVDHSVEGLRAQTENGRFIFDQYTSRDQLWIRDFMVKVRGAKDSLIKTFILKQYIEIGRKAANEYIKTMTEGYDGKEQQHGMLLANGWESFTHEGKSGTNNTFRKVADL
ncbi:hypothetical protein [Mucilaginibacter sp. L196]|uniref:hypothetical protein n=1 Tax=Mucilaginibacter sp. L196 TaxID=1641870 RepID=UPI00131DF8FA|nr:hypothetical protein [Mucilaginibacter sp. L196]